MSYWCCAQVDCRRERLALHCLDLAGYQTYVPRIRSPRGGSVALFPSYAFVLIELQWHAARWAPGVTRLIQNGGEEPAHVPDAVIDGLRGREGRNGLIVLPPPALSAPRFKSGAKVRITTGPLVGCLGLLDGMRPHQRIAVLLELLGSTRPIETAAADVALI
jgi:transcription antitermination factor NusG